MAATAPAVGFVPAPRVNLMPRAETERRGRSALARRWTLAVVVTLSVVAAASAFAFTMQIAAAARLAIENARTTSLLGDLAALSDVRGALALQDELEVFRADAMGTDVEWLPLLDRLQPAIPAEAAVVGFHLAPGGLPVGEEPADEIGVTGTLTVISTTVDDVTSIVRAIRPMSGVLEVDSWNTVYENGYYRHELRITLDQTLYTGDYATEEGAG
ncbi:hypothetical protein QL996_09290 [Planococcus sp. APC 4015]|nr:hypothetical protein [Planococcus sp. APC 4015]